MSAEPILRFHGLHTGQGFFYHFVPTRRVYRDGAWQQGQVNARNHIYLPMLDPPWNPDDFKANAQDVIAAGPSNGVFTIGYYISGKHARVGFLWTPDEVSLIDPYAQWVQLTPPSWWVDRVRTTAWEKLLGDFL